MSPSGLLKGVFASESFVLSVLNMSIPSTCQLNVSIEFDCIDMFRRGKGISDVRSVVPYRQPMHD